MLSSTRIECKEHNSYIKHATLSGSSSQWIASLTFSPEAGVSRNLWLLMARTSRKVCLVSIFQGPEKGGGR